MIFFEFQQINRQCEDLKINKDSNGGITREGGVSFGIISDPKIATLKLIEFDHSRFKFSLLYCYIAGLVKLSCH